MQGYPVITIIAVSVLLTPFCVLSDTGIKLSCSRQVRCSTKPDHTYGLIGNACYIYRNPCLLSLENCDRQASNQTLIVPTPKEKCVPLCNTACPDSITPVCGDYLNEKKTFDNKCEMDTYNCLNDKTFSLYTLRSCA